MTHAARIVLLASAVTLALSVAAQRTSSRVAQGPSLLSIDPLPAIDLSRMPAACSYEQMGIFCKAEVKLDRWLPIPVMVRLGDVERAQALEGKGVFRRLY